MQINNSKQLQERIHYLEWKKGIGKENIKENIKSLYAAIQPANILKSAIAKIYSPVFQHKIFSASLGIGTGIISNKLITNKRSPILKRIAGRLVQLGITNIVAKNASKIKAVSIAIGRQIFKKKNKQFDDNL